jgi:hypothetical protein
MIYSKDEALLDAFKCGVAFGISPTLNPCFTQGLDERGYWLLIESDDDGDNQTYELSQEDGLEHTDTGVEI